MPFKPLLIVSLSTLALAACAHGNVKTAADYNPPPPPPIQHPNYDPYTAYGQANATWQPTVINRNTTVVKPVEPATEWDRPDYEAPQWATRAQPSHDGGPPGTF
jgi:hypothetical protein